MRRLFNSVEEDTSINDQIDMTPLIDVLFVVLITFILIAPMLKSESVELATGSTKKLELAGDSTLKLHVTKEGLLLLSGHKIDKKQLLPMLQTTKNKKSLQLFFDKKAPFGLYQEVKGIAEKAGFDALHLIVNEQ
jgi:biopolymer transport protein ExbD